MKDVRIMLFTIIQAGFLQNTYNLVVTTEVNIDSQ